MTADLIPDLDGDPLAQRLLAEGEPTSNIMAEQYLLGAMLLSPDAIADAVEITRPDDGDFYRPQHQVMYEVIAEMFAAGGNVNVITVNAELTARRHVNAALNGNYLHTLVSPADLHPMHAASYARVVRATAMFRSLGEVAVTSADQASQAAGSPEQIAEVMITRALAITERSSGSDCRPVAELMPGALDEIEAIASHGGTLTGVPTGFADLDALTNGLHPCQQIVIAGRPGLGKSTLGLDIARAASIKHGLTTAVFSLEMGRNEIMMRMLSAEAGVLLHAMRTGHLRDEDWAKLARRMSEIADGPLFIDDSPRMSLMEIRAKCRRLRQRHDLKLVIIDYLQLMSSPGRAENRQQEVSAMSRSLKLLAKELEVPLVLLSQLNRGPEQRPDHKPVLSDLRESGSIESDADVVILLHREDAYEKESPRAGEADLIVAKHRNGPTATVTVAFQGHYSRFVDMAPEQGRQPAGPQQAPARSWSPSASAGTP